jgi:hypothetical protein
MEKGEEERTRVICLKILPTLSQSKKSFKIHGHIQHYPMVYMLHIEKVYEILWHTLFHGTTL